MRKAPGGDAYWTYVSLPGTQRVRFRIIYSSRSQVALLVSVSHTSTL